MSVCRYRPFWKYSGDIHDKFCQGENGDFPQLHELPPVALLYSFMLSNPFDLLLMVHTIAIMRPDIHVPPLESSPVENSVGIDAIYSTGNPLQKIELGPTRRSRNIINVVQQFPVHIVPGTARPDGKIVLQEGYVCFAMLLPLSTRSWFHAGLQRT